jgi:MFS family permease
MGVVKAAQVAGLLYVWRNVVQVATSYPIGILADRYGQRNILVIGYALGVLTAVLTAVAFAVSVDSVALLSGIFFVAGLYVAVQEAIETTVTAEMVSQETLATSYGALGTVNGAAKCAVDCRFAGVQLRGRRCVDGGGHVDAPACSRRVK